MSTSRYTSDGMIAMMKLLYGQEKIDYAYKHADAINFGDFNHLYDLLMLLNSESDEVALLVANKSRLSTANYNDTNLTGFMNIITMTAAHCSEVIPAFEGWIKNIQFDDLIKVLLPHIRSCFDNTPHKGSSEATQATYKLAYYIAKACMNVVTDNEKLSKTMHYLSVNPDKASINRFTYQREVEAHWEELDKKATLQSSVSSPGSPTMFARVTTAENLSRSNACNEDQHPSPRPGHLMKLSL